MPVRLIIFLCAFVCSLPLYVLNTGVQALRCNVRVYLCTLDLCTIHHLILCEG
jgi:hypothetical protein